MQCYEWSAPFITVKYFILLYMFFSNINNIDSTMITVTPSHLVHSIPPYTSVLLSAGTVRILPWVSCQLRWHAAWTPMLILRTVLSEIRTTMYGLHQLGGINSRQRSVALKVKALQIDPNLSGHMSLNSRQRYDSTFKEQCAKQPSCTLCVTRRMSRLQIICDSHTLLCRTVQMNL